MYRWLLLLAALPLAAQLHLIPQPRTLTPAPGALTLKEPISLSGANEDRPALESLANEIRAWGLRVETSSTGPGIRFRAASSVEHPEGYTLTADPAGVVIEGRTAQGRFWGAQTLRQLLRPASQAIAIPHVRIEDWPAFAHRGIMVDTSQGAVFSEEQLRKLIRIAAAFKLNIVNLYVEHNYPFAHSPLTAEGAQLTFDEIRRLVDYARAHHIDLIPQQQTFGHLHALLRWERYAPMAETPRGDVLVPGDPAAEKWVEQSARALAEVYPSRFFHIGADETFELGRGRSAARAAREGIGPLYAAQLQRTRELLAPLHRKLLFWGDIALKNPAGIALLPKDLIAVPWFYEAEGDFDKLIVPFRQTGMEVWVAPGVANWGRIFPNLTTAASNINRFVAAGRKHGATGVLNTHWNDDGEEPFNLSWWGIAFGAAASWQPADVDRAAFEDAFDWAFHRRDGHDLVALWRDLDAIHKIAGQVEDEWAWFDPFSRAGAERVRKMLPAAREIRLQSEHVLERLTRLPAPPRNPEVMPFLRFTARRLDTVGLRVVLAHDIGEYYRDALAHRADRERVTDDLREIADRSGVGRIMDVHDATAELKAMLRAWWPVENRPYYLDSLLVRYDAELLYWHNLRRRFVEIWQEYNRSRTLPPADQLGFVLP